MTNTKEWKKEWVEMPYGKILEEKGWSEAPVTFIESLLSRQREEMEKLIKALSKSEPERHYKGCICSQCLRNHDWTEGWNMAILAGLKELGEEKKT